MDFDGWGSNCFCCGAVMFVSQAVKEWSDMRNMNRKPIDDYSPINDNTSLAGVANNAVNQIDP